MCTGRAPDLEKSSSFVGRWMDILRPGYERVKDMTDEAERVARLEREAVLVSVENLMTFPFVKNAVEKNELTLHGLWTDIAEGSLEQFDSNLNDFVRI
jgi:carbonic anhydrase